MADTPNLGLPYPEDHDEIADYPTQAAEFAGLLDNATRLVQGTFANRPAPSAARFVYYLVTDLPGFLYLSTGSEWIEVAPGAGAVPIGGMIDYAGAGDPADTRYLLCDGRAISRTTYNALWTLVQESPGVGRYGNGDGSTTFNIPDLRGRASVGPDNMATGQGAAGRLTTTARTLGTAGGTEMHSHGVSVSSHTHAMGAHTHEVGTLYAGSHYHGAGSLYAANHAHGIAYDGVHGHSIAGSNLGTRSNYLWGSGQNQQGVYLQNTSPGTAPIDVGGGHSHGGATWGSGNVGVGGNTDWSGNVGIGGATGGMSNAVNTGAAGAQTVSSTSVGNAAPYAVVNKAIRVA